MNQAVIDYLKGRVVSAIPVIEGTITTTSDITLDNGMKLRGQCVRDINSYDKIEADMAAFKDAIALLTPGIELMLTKNN